MDPDTAPWHGQLRPRNRQTGDEPYMCLPGSVAITNSPARRARGLNAGPCETNAVSPSGGARHVFGHLCPHDLLIEQPCDFGVVQSSHLAEDFFGIFPKQRRGGWRVPDKT